MKSNVSVFLEVLHEVYVDGCNKSVADISDLRDLITIRARVKAEGVSFLTLTLPQFCKDFEKCLALGFVDPTLFRNFAKSRAIPAFLQGMLGQIFNRETGRIFYENDKIPADTSTIIGVVRQICLTFKKVEIPCTPEREARAVANFLDVERSFETFSPPENETDRFRHVSAVLWDNMLSSVKLDSLIPKHGPGQTADRISGNQKYNWWVWHERLEPYFPLIDCAYPVSAFETEELEKVTLVKPDQEQPVRVVLVPKTLKGPRIIAIEPVCMQYTQQAIRKCLYSTIESSLVTGGHINFRDQSVNQELALISSKTGQYSTIDLSDASDRVPRSFALFMFDGNPDLRDAVDACRSTSARLPDGTIISPLNKFASMGSALCFPVEAMYFYTICVAALLDGQHLPVNYENVYHVSREVYVYGDDLIVPTTYATIVLDYLQRYNCKVNDSKSFVSGNFRESCGVDAYNGYEVTPVYLGTLNPRNKQQARELISWTATANAFYLKGYWRVATLMFKYIERIIGPLPYVSSTSSALGRVSYLGYRSVERWNDLAPPKGPLHRFEVKAWIPKEVYRSDRIGGYSALMKSFLRLFRIHSESSQEDIYVEPVSQDSLHLERSALYGAVALQRRWVPVT